MSSSAMAPPLDLSHHFSYATKRREASTIKELYKYFLIPGIANLAGGLPNASYFPYDTLEASVARPQRFSPSETDATHAKSPDDARSSARVTIPRESPTANLQKKIDITTALQYGTVEGLPPLADFIRQFAREHLHPNVPYAQGPDTLLTCGSTDGFSKIVEAFTNIWDPDRDWIRHREGILCEEFVYMNAVATVKPRALNVAPVAIDAQGMRAHGKGGLADVLRNWDTRKGRRPHLLYTITIGQNPTGGILSVKRRKEIYALCQQYDIIIIEDDPYWNLQYPSAKSLAAEYRGQSVDTAASTRNYNAHGRSSGYAFLDSLVPSYLSIDTDGRVVRIDTFSKTIAPGCRLGWITAQPAIVERLARITETSSQQPSGFVQAMVAELILGQQTDDDTAAATKKKKQKQQDDQGWRMDGWVRWLEGLRGGYEKRMQDMCRVLEDGKFLIDADDGAASADESTWEVVEKVPMYDFVWPEGGMFVWIRASFDTHPLRERYSVEKLSRAFWVFLTRAPYLSLLAPGSMFAPSQQIAERSYPYFRLCFSAVPGEEVKSITERLVGGFRAFWQKKDLDDIDVEGDVSDMLQSMQMENLGNMLGMGC